MARLDDLGNDHRDLNAGKTVGQALAEYVDAGQRVDDVREQIRDLEAAYTGWSRFFLVTSSSGHIHSSMHCTTCRPTTTYGWLPELSGETEAEAVKAHGPSLCSVCFPGAPVDMCGPKITKAQAERKAF